MTNSLFCGGRDHGGIGTISLPLISDRFQNTKRSALYTTVSF